MEEVAKYVSLELSLIIEILGAVIVGLGLIQFVVAMLANSWMCTVDSCKIFATFLN